MARRTMLDREQPEEILELLPYLIYSPFPGDPLGRLQIIFRDIFAPLPDIFVEVLQVLAHRNHELVGIRAIDDAVIVAYGEADDVPHGN